MSPEEKIIVQFAMSLALYGEDDPRTQKIAADNADNRDLWPRLVETELIYRSMYRSLKNS